MGEAANLKGFLLIDDTTNFNLHLNVSILP